MVFCMFDVVLRDVTEAGFPTDQVAMCGVSQCRVESVIRVYAECVQRAVFKHTLSDVAMLNLFNLWQVYVFKRETFEK